MKHCSADESVILDDELRPQLQCSAEQAVRILCNFYFWDTAEGGRTGSDGGTISVKQNALLQLSPQIASVNSILIIYSYHRAADNILKILFL